MNVPEAFYIAIPVFEGAAERNLIRARLRYRIDGKLVMWFDLERPHKDLEKAVKDHIVMVAATYDLPVEVVKEAAGDGVQQLSQEQPA